MLVLVIVIAIVIFYLGFSIGRWFESMKFDDEMTEVKAQIEDLTKHIDERGEIIKYNDEVLKNMAWSLMRLMLKASCFGVEFDPEEVSETKKVVAEILEIDNIEDFCFTKEDGDRLFG